jgi:hypothetical protein
MLTALCSRFALIDIGVLQGIFATSDILLTPNKVSIRCQRKVSHKLLLQAYYVRNDQRDLVVSLLFLSSDVS